MTGRRLTVVLALSLAFNVLFIGGLVGAGIVWKRAEVQRPLQGMGQPARLRAAAQSLSPEHRRELLQTLRASARELRADARQARESRLDAARVLRESEYDRAALEAALTRARAADVAIRTRLEGVMLDFAARLPQQEREALVQALTRAAARRQAVNPGVAADE